MLIYTRTDSPEKRRAAGGQEVKEMRYTCTYTIGSIETEDEEFFERRNPGYVCTGETLVETMVEKYEKVEGRYSRRTRYIVMKGEFTRYGMCRDCGDHYIIARWSRYDRIDKETLQITFDVEDK